MSTVPQNLYTLQQYEEAARAYQARLTYKDKMESLDQATQRQITVVSLAQVHLRRADVHVFSDLLVQYHVGAARKIHRVVPDNFVVVHDGPIDLDRRLAMHLRLHPGLQIYWTMEYISRESKQKDRETNFRKYERELKVPYYLIFDPDAQELVLWRLIEGRYVSVKPNAQERYEVEELNLAVAIHEGWVRYWHEGKLIPVTEEMTRDLDAANHRANKAEERAGKAEERALAAEAEIARLRAQLGLDG
jgi:hypothetical protein